MSQSDKWTKAPQRKSGTWTTYRQTDPRWTSIFVPVGLQASGRWHRAGNGYAQYLALNPAAAWAEHSRQATIRSVDQARDTSRNLWMIRVEEHDVADLSTFDAYENCGLDPSIAIDDDHVACQELASHLVDEGYRGVLSPSAALGGGVNLTLFGGRYEREVVGDLDWTNPRPDRYVVVQKIASRSGMPDRLISETRHIGAPHLGYEEWAVES